MSGTSLDGMDICLVEFDTDNLKNFKILNAETFVYDRKWQENLKNAYTYDAVALAQLDTDFGKYTGQKVLQFIKKYNINPDDIDLIASHGQTVFHRPDLGYTTQIGSGAWINSITRIKTVCDFRTQDVALGGQGAPLVPIGDWYLFPQYKYCLNIGGFANISVKNEQNIQAFDICPANIVLNHYVNKIGFSYDEGGKIAAKGKLNKNLLKQLNNIDAYTIEGPQSFGWEFVENEILPIIDNYHLTIPDILRTFVEHIAMQTAEKISGQEVLITGGGAYNSFLIDRISALTDTKVIIPDHKLIDFKEALIFALLGLLRDENQINIFSSVTGASIDHSSGIIFNAY